MMVRSAWIRSSSLADHFQMITEMKSPTLVVDIEPLILGWSEPDLWFPSRAAAFIEQVRADAPSVQRIVFASNSHRALPQIKSEWSDGVSVVTHAAKPWRVGFAARLPRPVTVIGDQPATDGALAWRLGGSFCEWVHQDDQPLWPRVQRLMGAAVTPLMLRPCRSGGWVER